MIPLAVRELEMSLELEEEDDELLLFSVDVPEW
jgi:hypothetical protein